MKPTAALVLLAGIATAGPSMAYFVGTCNGVPVERDDLVPQFRGNAFAGADPAGQFEDGIAVFNRNPTNFSYWNTVDYDTDFVVGLNNGHTEVWPTIDNDLFNNNMFAAVGFYYLDGCTIDEGDVVFNLQRTWTPVSVKTDYNAYGDSGADISSIPATVHELGHTVGFDHDCVTYNIMGDAYQHHWANGPDAAPYAGEGMIDGMIALYGNEGPPTLVQPDVSVTHWEYSSCSSEGYSVHRRTSVIGVSGDPLDQVPDLPEPRYIAAAGQRVEATFTYENLGNTLEEGVEIGFYYSDDDTITTMDRRIGGASLSFIRNNPDTRRFTIDLPPDLPQGDGYLGVIVDENDVITEIFEKNNASYIGMRIDGVDLDGDGEPDDGSETTYQYAAKVVCGRQESADDLRLRPGVYGTTVNVLNPTTTQVRFRKRLAVSFPPDPQEQGETYDFGFDTLDGLRALETNCDDLFRRAFGGSPPEPYVEGFVVVTSPVSLDVTAVYTVTPSATAAGLSGPDGLVGTDAIHGNSGHGGHYGCGCCGCCGGGCGGGDGGDGGNGGDGGPGGGGGAVTIDVEQIRERVIMGTPPRDDGEPDLIPVRPFSGDGSQLTDNGYCLANPDDPSEGIRRIRVIVRNQGDAAAGASVLRVRFGRNGSPPPPSTATPTANVQMLAASPGPGHEASFEFPVPVDCYGPLGQATFCHYEVTVDSAGDVDESNETNNTDNSMCLRPHIEG